MASIAQSAAQVLLYLFTHREEIKQVVVNVDALLSDAPGTARAAAVGNFIAQGIREETQIEVDFQKALPFIGPIFDGFVAKVKKEAGIANPAPAT